MHRKYGLCLKKPANKPKKKKQLIESAAETANNTDRDIGSTTLMSGERESMWQKLLDTLQSTGDDDTMEKQAYCRIDRNLAVVLDGCSILGKSRTQVVNAMLRVFMEEIRPELLEYRFKVFW